jgi:hypothetical protein
LILLKKKEPAAPSNNNCHPWAKNLLTLFWHAENKKPLNGALKNLVAGAGFEPTTFGL